MNSLTLRKVLTNSVFSETTIPYRTFVESKQRLIVVANSFHTQWSARDLSLSSISLLYNSDTLELKNSLDVNFRVNDVAFHPVEKIIALATGSYDGGAYFEGELLVWNYGTNEVTSVLANSREVVKCEFCNSGDKLSFVINPPDDLESTTKTSSSNLVYN
jgi:hypothetical protein